MILNPKESEFMDNLGVHGMKLPGKFLNVVLEKDGDQLDRSCEKQRSITYSRAVEEYPT
jgi:hypothetical protein